MTFTGPSAIPVLSRVSALTAKIITVANDSSNQHYLFYCIARTTWNGSSARLNRTSVMDSAYRKSTEDYQQIREMEQAARIQRKDQWPEYSEYTDRYLLRSRIASKPSQYVTSSTFSETNVTEGHAVGNC